MDSSFNEEQRAIDEARRARRLDSTDSSIASIPGRLDKQQVRVHLGMEPDVPEDAEDIDPEQWLAHDDENVYDYVETRAGRLKIAALSEKELRIIRRSIQRPQRAGSNSQANREADLERLRASIVAYSLNKAYEWFGTDKELTPKRIVESNKLSGEVSILLIKIQEISGFKAEVLNNSSFFSMG